MYKLVDKQGKIVTAKKSGKVLEFTSYKTAFIGRDVMELHVPKYRRPIHVVGSAS